MTVRENYRELAACDWTHDEIRDYYDTTNVTLLTLGGMLGMTGSEVKEILMEQKEKK